MLFSVEFHFLYAGLSTKKHNTFEVNTIYSVLIGRLE